MKSNKATIEDHWNDARKRKFGEAYALLERAWAAGLFDGEGHAAARDDRAGFRCEVQQITENRAVLDRFMTVVGVGKIVDLPPRRDANSRPASAWSVTNQPDAEKVFDMIGDFLCSAKRDQFARALSVPVRSALEHDRDLPVGTIAVALTHEGDA